MNLKELRALTCAREWMIEKERGFVIYNILANHH